MQNVENVDIEHIGNTGQITGQSVRQPLVMEHKFSYSSQRKQLTSGNNVYTFRKFNKDDWEMYTFHTNNITYEGYIKH